MLGDPLVTRKGRGIVATPRATELAPGIARAIREIELALLAARFEPATCTRTFRRQVVVSVPSFIAAAEVVAASDLVTVLPHSLLKARARSLGLRAIEVALPLGVVEIAMCWHDRTHADPAARAFRDLVKRVANGVEPVPRPPPTSRTTTSPALAPRSMPGGSRRNLGLRLRPTGMPW